MKRPSLSLAMIVKNEEENLPRLFESVKECVDEIHITDTGSTDGTRDVAARLGAQVHSFEWCDDFGAARNASFGPVKTDYVFWLDGDDILENPDGFKGFRDNVMSLADYWIAAYHYSSDKSGKSLCTFARERVFKTSKQMQWKYFVHEGVTPTSPTGDVKVQYTPTWAVRHMRTDQDLLKDRSRNLNLFEKNKHRLDARMKYYYGKELFEAQKPMEAIQSIGQALTDPNLEMHDRILGMQYACYAYIQTNQYAQAIQMAHQGTILAPHRAEFHSVIGDCYVKMNRFSDAVPAYSAAKACQVQVPQGFASAIFHTEDMYTVYPRNQLARIHANLGEFDKATKEAGESTSMGSLEGAALLEEIGKIKTGIADFKNAEPCGDIVISCPPQSAYEFDPGIAQERSMGGSETALIEMAQWLRKHSGRPVKVFNMRSVDKKFDGVDYISTAKLNSYFSEFKPWLHIAWRHNIKVTDAPTFLWCHDLTTPGAEHHQNYIKHLCLTPFHKRYVMAMQGIPEDKIHVTRNGIKPERFSKKDAWPEKEPFRFIFSSSPDRGLDRAMRVLDRVRKVHPEVTLHVHYGIEHLHKYGLQALADKLKYMMEERKDWVTYHGATQQDALIHSMKKSSYCVQPSDWIETSMISAMELTCAGVYPIMRRVGGVADTLSAAEQAGMATLVDSDCITEGEYDLYAEKVCQAIEKSAVKQVNVDADSLSWEKVAQEWLKDLPSFLPVETPSVLTGEKHEPARRYNPGPSSERFRSISP